MVSSTYQLCSARRRDVGGPLGSAPVGVEDRPTEVAGGGGGAAAGGARHGLMRDRFEGEGEGELGLQMLGAGAEALARVSFFEFQIRTAGDGRRAGVR